VEVHTVEGEGDRNTSVSLLESIPRIKKPSSANISIPAWPASNFHMANESYVASKPPESAVHIGDIIANPDSEKRKRVTNIWSSPRDGQAL
jgi:hypothetical protein